MCIDPLSMRSEIHSMCQTGTCHSLTHLNLFFTISCVDTLLHNDLMYCSLSSSGGENNSRFRRVVARITLPALKS